MHNFINTRENDLSQIQVKICTPILWYLTAANYVVYKEKARFLACSIEFEKSHIDNLGELCFEISSYFHKIYEKAHTASMKGKQVIRSSMGKEVDRAKEAARLAADCNVAMITGGDAGVYGMASIVLEVVEHEFPGTDVEVLPGVTAATAAASRLGSPLSGDYVTLSLSDLLTPWELIEKRLHLAFQMGVPVALYNPKSRGRPLNLGKAIQIALQYRSPETPVGVVRNVFRSGEETFCVTLASLGENDELVDMHSILIIGGDETRFWEENGDVKGIITPRGYHRKYVY